MNKETIIKVPEGCVITDIQLSDNSAIINWDKIYKLPSTWEEFCMNNPIKNTEYFIGVMSDILKVEGPLKRNPVIDKSTIKTKELSEAILALIQLTHLRDCYNTDKDGVLWEPDWNDSGSKKYIICNYKNMITIKTEYLIHHILHFKTPEIRNVFVKNFISLIEKAKVLL